MAEELLGVDEVARILGLHPKTVRRLIHDGRLKAGRVGRQWRIARRDLDLLSAAGAQGIGGPQRVSGRAANSLPQRTAGSGEHPSISVSAVVNVESMGAEEALRLSNTVLAVLMSEDPDRGPTRYDHIYYPEEKRARYIFWGSPLFVGRMLTLLSQISDRKEE